MKQRHGQWHGADLRRSPQPHHFGARPLLAGLFWTACLCALAPEAVVGADPQTPAQAAQPEPSAGQLSGGIRPVVPRRRSTVFSTKTCSSRGPTCFPLQEEVYPSLDLLVGLASQNSSPPASTAGSGKPSTALCYLSPCCCAPASSGSYDRERSSVYESGTSWYSPRRTASCKPS